MHSILSFSANHLAWISQSSETRSIAIQHRQIALRGLHEAIGAFSQSNSDAVLAASLLLAWQATDWYVNKLNQLNVTLTGLLFRRNWASLMTGISSVSGLQSLGQVTSSQAAGGTHNAIMARSVDFR